MLDLSCRQNLSELITKENQGSQNKHLIYRKITGAVIDIESTESSLGGFINLNYAKTEFDLSAGDVILVIILEFTERFTEKGRTLKLKEMLKNTVCDEWRGNRPQDYDITFVVIKLK